MVLDMKLGKTLNGNHLSLRLPLLIYEHCGSMSIDGKPYIEVLYIRGERGSVVVKALCYKLEGHGFNSR
jgi:hypothetical protein